MPTAVLGAFGIPVPHTVHIPSGAFALIVNGVILVAKYSHEKNMEMTGCKPVINYLH